jgi:hypothetical protein
MIYIVGISIAFLLSLLLPSKRGKTQADKILTVWMLVTGVHLLLFYFYFSGIAYKHPFWLGLSIPLPLVQGPFLFLYTAALTNQEGDDIFSVSRDYSEGDGFKRARER